MKIPKPPKLPRPKVRDLRMALKGLLSVSIQNRIAALAAALQWYDDALPYLAQKKGLPSEAMRRLEIAVKCRKQAQGTNQDHEKETALAIAVRAYEKVCVALKPVAVDNFYQKFEQRKHVLQKKQEVMERKYGAVVGLLEKAINGRVKLQLADAQKAVQYNPALTSLSYNREAAKQMSEKFWKEGILAVFVEQLDVLAQHAALESDGHGGWQYDPARHVEIANEMLRAFDKFARSPDAPARLVRHRAAQVRKTQ